MGEIYKAHDTRLNRIVAIKVLTSAATGDPDRRRRFIQEAQAASALNHPNIITIHDIVSEGDTEFMVMEYVSGKTLVDLIPKGGLTVPQLLKYSVQMADALQAAHTAGIVHRDMKPGNVMVTEAGLVKILDFGLAKLTDRGPLSQMSGPNDATQTIADAPLTVEGSIIGTVSYMSPEQAQGKKVDTRSDIFTFGVVLYEMATGLRAFTGESALTTLSAILRDEVKPIAQIAPEVPPQLEQVVSRCLRKAPDQRWQTMKDVQMALAALKHESDSGQLHRARLTGMQTPPTIPPAAPNPVPAARSNGLLSPPILASIAGGVALLIAIGGGAWWLKHRQPAQPAAETAAVAPEPPPPAVVEPAPETAAAAPAADAAQQPAPPPADATLTNDNIVEMVQAKVPANVIMSQIRASKTNFTLTQAELIRLTKAGVPENVIEQMRNPKRPVSTGSASTTAAAVKQPPAPSSGQPAPAAQPQVQTPPPQQPAPQQTAPAPEPAPAPATPKQISLLAVTLTDGVPFGITLTEDIPENAEEGRPLRFTVTKDFRVGDNVVIAKGASVTGAIAEVPGKKKIFGIGGGKMTLKLMQADAVDGHKVNVRALQAKRAEGVVRPVDTGKSKPKDVAATAGTEYLAYIDGDQTVSIHK